MHLDDELTELVEHSGDRLLRVAYQLTHDARRRRTWCRKRCCACTANPAPATTTRMPAPSRT